MAMFDRLNKTYLHHAEGGKLNCGSFYFRSRPWEVNEMTSIMKGIAERAVLHYFAKQRQDHFRRP